MRVPNYPNPNFYDSDVDFYEDCAAWERAYGAHAGDNDEDEEMSEDEDEDEEMSKEEAEERAYLRRCYAIATCSNQVAYGIALEQARKEMREWQKSGKRVAKEWQKSKGYI